MVAPAVSVFADSAKEGFGDTIRIGLHERLLEMPTQRWEEIKEELRALRERADMAETERITLRSRVRSLKVVET
ncbi:hypothetical protein Tco_1507247 [Tanacetum coccineum]